MNLLKAVREAHARFHHSLFSGKKKQILSTHHKDIAGSLSSSVNYVYMYAREPNKAVVSSRKCAHEAHLPELISSPCPWLPVQGPSRCVFRQHLTWCESPTPVACANEWLKCWQGTET